MTDLRDKIAEKINEYGDGLPDTVALEVADAIMELLAKENEAELAAKTLAELPAHMGMNDYDAQDPRLEKLEEARDMLSETIAAYQKAAKHWGRSHEN